MLINIVLLKIGGPTAVSVYGVLVYVGEVMQPILYGVSDSLQPAIGYNYGAGNMQRVRSIGACVLVSCGIVSLVGAGVIFFCSEAIALMFIDAEETELFALCSYALKLFSITYLSRWLGFVAQSFFVAIDKAVPAAILSVMNAFVFPVLILLVLWPMGLDGIWLNIPLSSLLVSILAGIIFYNLKNNIFTKT